MRPTPPRVGLVGLWAHEIFRFLSTTRSSSGKDDAMRRPGFLNDLYVCQPFNQPFFSLRQALVNISAATLWGVTAIKPSPLPPPLSIRFWWRFYGKSHEKFCWLLYRHITGAKHHLLSLRYYYYLVHQIYCFAHVSWDMTGYQGLFCALKKLSCDR